MSSPRTSEAQRIAAIIQERRKELSLTRSGLARRAGLSHTTIMRIEECTFAHPSPRSLKAIADGLDLPVRILLNAAGWMPKNDKVTKRPYVAVAYYHLSPDAARDLCNAIEETAKRHGGIFDTYHQTVVDYDGKISQA
ncbi:helix-turn-helix domain-containing protein [Nocardia anaemiae]|uniref:helix-turn-helix domain-containing protein n=1 Tax=Nocardia anaemiae TaxID=263910 RepID=UPI0009FC78CD|nr:helix-turn-helix transcriptional regulator [Nocardia anaemiae]